jgi:hypothetical protein
MQPVDLREQIEVLERVLMERPYNGDDMLALGATLRLLKLFMRFETPLKRFLTWCIANVAQAEADPIAQQLAAVFPDGKVTLTVRQ